MGIGNAVARLITTGVLAGFAASPGLAGCLPGTVDLRGDGGASARFSVEVVDSAEERAQGLMFRESLARSAGMLFVYDAPKRAVFWMKNTLIPLDMIFADASGTVTHVHPMAVPQDTTQIDGGEGVVYVLEINGGLAARLGIGAGSVLRHPAIDPAIAAWPCDAP